MEDVVPVWSRPVRVLHWVLASAVTVAWVRSSASAPSVHEVAGCVAAGAVVARAGWGAICGPRSERLARCARAFRQGGAYLRDLARASERRFLGHNPLGSLMVLALLTCAGCVCFTGWLYTTDRFWGYGWLARLHEVLGWSLASLVCAHVAGVAFTSARQRENLVLAMLTGRKARRLATGAAGRR